MFIEKRKSGTFYLRENEYNPDNKKRPTIKISKYLGNNPISAKNKLKTLTEVPSEDLQRLLDQIPETPLYEVELDKLIKTLEKVKGFHTEGATRYIDDALKDLKLSKEFILRTRAENILTLTIDCANCRFKIGNHCDHFKRSSMSSNIKTVEGRPVRCHAFEKRQNQSNGTIKTPSYFKTL